MNTPFGILKKTLLLIAALAVALGASAQYDFTNSEIRELHKLDPAVEFSFDDGRVSQKDGIKYRVKSDVEIYNDFGVELFSLPFGSSADLQFLYKEGLVAFKYVYNGRYGAVDLAGNLIVPFEYKNFKSLLKSEAWKTAQPSDAGQAIHAQIRKFADFNILRNKLNDYRKSRYVKTQSVPSTKKRAKRGRGGLYAFPGINQVTTANDTRALTDVAGNYVTDFYKTEGKDIVYDAGFNIYGTVDSRRKGALVVSADGNILHNYVSDWSEGFRIKYDDMSIVFRNTYVDDVTYSPDPFKFVSNFVNLNMKKWYEKDEFETRAEYAERTTVEMCDVAKEYYANAAMSFYLNVLDLKPFTLGSYDRENESYLVKSAVGNVAMKVPFESSIEFRNKWETSGGLKPSSYGFSAIDGGITLTSIAFDSFTGSPDVLYATYSVEGETSPKVEIVNNPYQIRNESIDLAQRTRRDIVSDVDKDIPQTTAQRANTFALIIANENYTSVAPVDFAVKDGKTFAEYCRKTLGIPESNIRTHYDATYGNMLSALTDMSNIANAYDGDIDLIVYYAGHGAPEEGTREPFLLPIDAYSVDSRICLSLNKLYADLAQMPTRSTTVFLDACFSGASRAESQDGRPVMLSSKRAVELDPDDAAVPDGRSGSPLVVFSATTAGQTAIPDRQQGHGLFTYYLLKKLKDNRGMPSFGELWDYLDENIRRRSSLIQPSRMQQPSVKTSPSAAYSWRNLGLR